MARVITVREPHGIVTYFANRSYTEWVGEFIVFGRQSGSTNATKLLTESFAASSRLKAGRSPKVFLRLQPSIRNMYRQPNLHQSKRLWSASTRLLFRTRCIAQRNGWIVIISFSERTPPCSRERSANSWLSRVRFTTISWSNVLRAYTVSH